MGARPVTITNGSDVEGGRVTEQLADVNCAGAPEAVQAASLSGEMPDAYVKVNFMAFMLPLDEEGAKLKV